MLHTENLKDPSDEEMEKAVRNVVVYEASGDMSIAAVLLDRWFLIFSFFFCPEITIIFAISFSSFLLLYLL